MPNFQLKVLFKDFIFYFKEQNDEVTIMLKSYESLKSVRIYKASWHLLRSFYSKIITVSNVSNEFDYHQITIEARQLTSFIKYNPSIRLGERQESIKCENAQWDLRAETQLIQTRAKAQNLTSMKLEPSPSSCCVQTVCSVYVAGLIKVSYFL